MFNTYSQIGSAPVARDDGGQLSGCSCVPQGTRNSAEEKKSVVDIAPLTSSLNLAARSTRTSATSCCELLENSCSYARFFGERPSGPLAGGSSEDRPRIAIRLVPHCSTLPNTCLRYTIRRPKGGDSTPRPKRRSQTCSTVSVSPWSSSTPSLSSSPRAAFIVPANKDNTLGTCSGTELEMHFPSNDCSSGTRIYTVDDVYDPYLSDGYVCKHLSSDLVEQIAAGGSVCVLCCGLVEKGMPGIAMELVPTLVRSFFRCVNKDSDVVELSYTCVLGDRMYDVLNPSAISNGGATVPCGLSRSRCDSCSPLYRVVSDTEEALAHVCAAERRGTTWPTSSDTVHSRPHFFFLLRRTTYFCGLRMSTAEVAVVYVAEGSGASSSVEGTSAASDETILQYVHDRTVSDQQEVLLSQFLARALTCCRPMFLVTVSLERGMYGHAQRCMDAALAASHVSVAELGAGVSTDVRPGGQMSWNDSLPMADMQQMLQLLKSLQDADGTVAARILGEAAMMQHRQWRRTLRNRICALRDFPSLHNHLVMEDTHYIWQALLRVKESLREAQMQQRDDSQCDSSPGEDYSTIREALVDRETRCRTLEHMLSSIRRAYTGVCDSFLRECRAHRMLQDHHTTTLTISAERTRSLQTELCNARAELYRERVDRTVREETMQHYSDPSGRTEECARLEKAWEEQQIYSDTLQKRLTSMEEELDRTESMRQQLEREVKHREDVFRSLWSLLTPHERARFSDYPSPCTSTSSAFSSALASPVGGRSVLLHANEATQLRSQVRELKRMLEDEVLRSRQKDFRIEDLEATHGELMHDHAELETQYAQVLQGEKRSLERQEQLEHQLTESVAYIDNHNVYHRQLKQKLALAIQECRRLQQQYEQSQRTATEQLQRAQKMQQLSDATHLSLTAALGEAEGKRATLERERDYYKLRVNELERELASERRHHTVAVSRRQVTAEAPAAMGRSGPKCRYVQLNRAALRRALLNSPSGQKSDFCREDTLTHDNERHPRAQRSTKHSSQQDVPDTGSPHVEPRLSGNHTDTPQLSQNSLGDDSVPNVVQAPRRVR